MNFSFRYQIIFSIDVNKGAGNIAIMVVTMNGIEQIFTNYTERRQLYIFHDAKRGQFSEVKWLYGIIWKFGSKTAPQSLFIFTI